MNTIVAQLIPGITIAGGGASDFAIDGDITPGDGTATFEQATFTVFGAAFPSPAATPLPAVVEAGTGASAVASGDALASLSFTGLAAGVYDFFIVGKDAGGEYTAVTKIMATVTGDEPPGGFNPAIFIGAGLL